jgi:phosphoglycerate-specific signal transduction histidine kinase
MDKLKAIKPLVIVPDNSLIYLILSIVILLTILLLIIYYLRQRFLKKNADKNHALKQLKALNFNESKIVAYQFSKYCPFITTDKNLTTIKHINAALKPYKYKKIVGDLSANLIIKIKEVIGV